MLVSHEVPLELLTKSREFNDYDYALVHLMYNPQYRKFYEDSLRSGRTVYLDNSCFELGESYNPEKFMECVEQLGSINPDNFYYVLPDSIDNVDETIALAEQYTSKFKKIGVLQGRTVSELRKCYDYMKDRVDIIALPYRAKPFRYPDGSCSETLRFKFIQRLQTDKKIHLLGCYLAKLLGIYQHAGVNIHSVDTSFPIVKGIECISMDELASITKPKQKMADLMDIKLTDKQIDYILYNVKSFKDTVNDTHTV